MLIGSCASPTPALQLSGPEFVNLAPVFLLFQFMTPLAGLCIGFAFARARLASLGYQSYVLNNLFAATLFSARIPDALHLLPLCSPPTALSHGLSLIPLAAPGCCWLLLAAFCMLLFWAPGAILKTRFREGVFEPLENGPIWGAFGYFLVHWRRPGRRGRFLGFQNNA